MQIKPTKLTGLYTIELDKFEDARGYNMQIYQQALYKEAGVSVNFVEQLMSYSNKGVLRGLHYDIGRWKLCQCLAGVIYYVAVDIKTNQFEAFTLSADKPMQILKSPYLAHGFQIISGWALFLYLTSEYRDINREKEYPWDGYNIPWPITPPILSDKDRSAK